MEKIHGLDLRLTCDGGSLGNPGRMYGSWLVEANGSLMVEARNADLGGGVENGKGGTSNQAEYIALLSGLESIIALLRGNLMKASRLVIVMDSQMTVNQVSGVWQIKQDITRKYRDYVWILLRNFGDWRIEWVPREHIVAVLGH